MKLEVFSVMDAAVGAFMQPFFCRSRGEAIRSFSEACNDPKTGFHKNAADYTLFSVGSWDDGSATFDCAPPVRIVSALEVVVKVVDPPFGGTR